FFQAEDCIRDRTVTEVQTCALPICTAVWHIDGRPVRASVWNFAGAWAGFSDGLDTEFVVAVGIGLEPDELHMSAITEGSSYGVDLGAQLDPAALSRLRHELPLAWLPSPRRQTFHTH